jgi:hypothetical protein
LVPHVAGLLGEAVKLLASVLEMLVAVWIVLSVQQFCFG